MLLLASNFSLLNRSIGKVSLGNKQSMQDKENDENNPPDAIVKATSVR
jgi:hypothetical protein